MAQGKKSFVLYTDLLEVVEELTDEEAGLLFKTILRYVNDMNPEVPKKVKLAFIPIRQDLKRDLEKYETIRNKNRENINKRWNEYRKNKEQPNTSVYDRTKSNYDNVNDNVNVNVNDNDNDNDNEINISKDSGNIQYQSVYLNNNYNNKYYTDYVEEEAEKVGLTEYEKATLKTFLEKHKIIVEFPKEYVANWARQRKAGNANQEILNGFNKVEDENETS